ncbi:hypothetical protein ACQP1K_23765 [Sphaerimonospora sp. CA-214678]|uniref:hypothetical protein n=1 Tax=Sphaerimonospora sp. CA-214678 TaxID=3240029 RepID=UPI003D9311E3
MTPGGPHEPDRPHAEGGDHRTSPPAAADERLPTPPTLHHEPPAPSPWASPPFAAPLPEGPEPSATAEPSRWPLAKTEEFEGIRELKGIWGPVGGREPEGVQGTPEDGGPEAGGAQGGGWPDDLEPDAWAPRPSPARPSGHRTGRSPYAAPYGMSQSGQAQPEPRHGRPPDSVSEGETEGRTGGEAGTGTGAPGKRRRLVTRPDKLVASGRRPRASQDGPPEQGGPPEQDRPPEQDGHPAQERPPGEGGTPWRTPPASPWGSAEEPETTPWEGAGEDFDDAGGSGDGLIEPPDRRGRTAWGPGGRPGPRRRPLVVAAVLLVAAALGVVVVNRVGGSDGAGLTLAAGEGRSADAAFTAPGLSGSGSSQVLNAIASTGSTIVAAGSDTTGPVPKPLFLVSADGGGHWELGGITGFEGGSAGYEPAAGAVGRLAGGAGRWLAVGTDVPGRAGGPAEPSSGAAGRGGWANPAAARGMWVSSDGRSWTAVGADRLTEFWSQDRITDVARTATGFVAVGATVLSDGTAGPVAWVSPDGTSWTRVDADRIGSGRTARGIRAVAARGDSVVALAEPASKAGQGPVVLRSDDGGRSWRRTTGALPGVRPEPGTLTTTKKGFLLVPIRQKPASGDVRAHCSRDGVRWSRCGKIGRLGPDGTGVRGLTSSAAGVAAVVEYAWERYAVYTSEDGHRWTRGANLGEIPGTLRGLTITDGGLLVASGDKRGPGDAENLPVLITAGKGGAARPVPLGEIAGLDRTVRDPVDIAAAGGVFVAVGSANGDAAIWTSGDDGASWTEAGSADLLGGPGRQALSGVTHGPYGWLAVGGAMTDPAVTRPLLVTSADGTTWRSGPALEVDRGHFLLAPRVVAAGRKGYVLAGEDHGSAGVVPALWFSPDLKRFTRVPPARMPAGGAGVRVADVTATPYGFVAVGGAGTADREAGVVWVSPDGLNWASRGRVLPQGARSAGLRHVVTTESGDVVVIGVAATGEGVRPFSARADSASASAAATGEADGGGMEWEYGSLPAEAGATVFDVTATRRGLVAVGSYGPAAEGDSAAWISADGLGWTRRTLASDGSGGPGARLLGGPGAQWLGTVAVSGEAVVAIGRSPARTGDHLTVWRSRVTEEAR